ncbi:MAG: FliI/YscN family ATPase [Phycisphaerae bacterium]|nr:FliI/YscN family ATPase [Phycisphaerae bacterium]
MSDIFSHERDALPQTLPFEVSGRVSSVSGLTVRAAGLSVPVGSTCEIAASGERTVTADVIGFDQRAAVLMPLAGTDGLALGQTVRCIRTAQRVGIGPEMLGRVIDALGRTIDNPAPFTIEERYPLWRPAPPALQRRRIDEPLSVGVRSINAMLTIGRGQRIGVFAGTGVGKSVLLGMMARYTSADVAVIALVGERGREVGDFLERDLGADGLRRSVVVVSTSDQSPVMRVRAAGVATATAEYFRDQGADVLLLMDSVTRVAMAQRQIGLAVGEPPTTKGYTPSVFSLLPQMLERAGRTPHGSITGLYTVLVEGDDPAEPIADAVRGILDGHIVMERAIAERGRYPAINVLKSISRLMPMCHTAEENALVGKAREALSLYHEMEELIRIGAYKPGADAQVDEAVRVRPALEAFLTQSRDDRTPIKDGFAMLAEALQ